MNFEQLKSKIVAWFWKLGYRLGNAVGLLGKGLVDEAFSSGFKDAAFQAINMSSLLDNLEESYEDEFSAMADFSGASSPGSLSAVEFKSTFMELFENHFHSAHSVFVNNGWTMEYGSFDPSPAPGKFTKDTQQDGSMGTHISYTNGTEEVIVELTRDTDNTILSAAIVVGK